MFVGENKVVFEMIFAITDNNAKRNKRRDYNNKVVVSKQKKNKKKYPSEIVTRKFNAFSEFRNNFGSFSTQIQRQKVSSRNDGVDWFPSEGTTFTSLDTYPRHVLNTTS